MLPNMQSDGPTELRGLALVLERMSRRVSGLIADSGMHPVQWSALRFLNRAGPRARTVGALARYQGSTPGPASRTVATLVRKGLVEMHGSTDDRRIKRLDLTDAGRKMLEGDPLHHIATSLGQLSPDQRAMVLQALDMILEELGAIGEVPPPAT